LKANYKFTTGRRRRCPCRERRRQEDTAHIQHDASRTMDSLFCNDIRGSVQYRRPQPQRPI